MGWATIYGLFRMATPLGGRGATSRAAPLSLKLGGTWPLLQSLPRVPNGYYSSHTINRTYPLHKPIYP